MCYVFNCLLVCCLIAVLVRVRRCNIFVVYLDVCCLLMIDMFVILFLFVILMCVIRCLD